MRIRERSKGKNLATPKQDSQEEGRSENSARGLGRVALALQGSSFKLSHASGMLLLKVLCLLAVAASADARPESVAWFEQVVFALLPLKNVEENAKIRVGGKRTGDKPVVA